MMKIYNTNQEIGCRILLILNIVKDNYSIERIGYYDYFSLHFSDLDTFNKLGYKAKINTHTTSYIN